MTNRSARLGRRGLLQLCGGSALLASWLNGAIGRAQGVGSPQRLVIISRPNGSIAENWLPNGTRGSILEPFAEVWPHTVAVKGVNVRPSNGTTSGSHEAGALTLMTGAALGPTFRTNDDFQSTAQSLDQKLLKQSASSLSGAMVESLQLGAHGDQDGGNETPNVTLSYSGPNTPLYPQLNPYDVYSRLFADFVPGGATAANLEELARRRARRRSVLDFARADLTRVRAEFPAAFKEDLDIHEAAIRELELSLDGTSTDNSAACAAPVLDADLKPGGNYLNAAKIAKQHFALIRAAFACNMTRVVTFMWGTGASALGFGPLGSDNHHSTSHADDRPVLSKIDRWFAEQTAAFIATLAATDDIGGGKLLDRSLVWYTSEVSEGASHSFDDYPFLFFGGDGVGLKQRGRILDVSGQNKTTNDIWSALAPQFGGSLGGFETAATTPISGLFG